jgi:hypothetical protein
MPIHFLMKMLAAPMTAQTPKTTGTLKWTSMSDDLTPILNPRPIQVEATRSLREQLDGPLLEKVTNVLQFMDAQGLNLTIFLDALSLEAHLGGCENCLIFMF